MGRRIYQCTISWPGTLVTQWADKTSLLKLLFWLENGKSFFKLKRGWRRVKNRSTRNINWLNKGRTKNLFGIQFQKGKIWRPSEILLLDSIFLHLLDILRKRKRKLWRKIMDQFKFRRRRKLLGTKLELLRHRSGR